MILGFNRLKHLKKNKEAVAKILGDSQIVEVSDDGQKIRRKLQFQKKNAEEFLQDTQCRTVYVVS